MRRRTFVLVGLATIVVAAILVGLFIGWERSARLVGLIQNDTVGRLVSDIRKQEIDCPPQNARTGVLLVFGQSNSANYGAHRYETRHPQRVINYFHGRCFAASEPLLGATGHKGGFATLLADSLLERGTFDTVVIIASGIRGSSILRWRNGQPLNDLLMGELDVALDDYKITEVIWHQGETDYSRKTDPEDYASAFHSLRASLVRRVASAPMFIAIATRCGRLEAWRPDNPVARAQRGLIDDREVYLGADTDGLLGPEDRYDGCHFSASGQRRTAAAYADAIAAVRGRTK